MREVIFTCDNCKIKIEDNEIIENLNSIVAEPFVSNIIKTFTKVDINHLCDKCLQSFEKKLEIMVKNWLEN